MRTVEVIIPVWRLESTFPQLISELEKQIGVKIYLTVVSDRKDDPTFKYLKQHKPKLPLRMLVAGPCKNNGQKVHNVRYALIKATKTQHIVFVDADNYNLQKTCIQKLIAPLKNAAVGASCGWRVYYPMHRNFANTLQSCWEIYGTYSFFFDKEPIGVHGGLFALRRVDVLTYGIVEGYKNIISEDSWLTARIRRIGKSIVGVSQAVTLNQPINSLPAVYNYVVRQNLWIKIYISNFYMENRLWASGYFLFVIGAVTVIPIYPLISLIGLFLWLFYSSIIYQKVCVKYTSLALPKKGLVEQIKNWVYLPIAFVITPLIQFMVNVRLQLNSTSIKWANKKYIIDKKGRVGRINSV